MNRWGREICKETITPLLELHNDDDLHKLKASTIIIITNKTFFLQNSMKISGEYHQQ